VAKNVTEISVFLASPDDVSEDREAVVEAIRELNDILSETGAIILKLMRWQTHAYPSVGEDPQAVINEQIGNDYDIFIGILWKKFGTPTGRAASGTQEEFERAYRRHKANPKQLRIMFYFRNSPVELKDIDADQLTLVRRFQEDLPDKGVLYWEYQDAKELTDLLRLHLSKHIGNWGETWGPEQAPGVAVTTPGSEGTTAEDTVTVSVREAGSEPARVDDIAPDREDEEGFLDLIDTGTNDFGDLTEVIGRMGAAMLSFGETTSERTAELRKATVCPNPDPRRVKHICNRAAQDMERLVGLTEPDVKVFGRLFSRGMDAYSRAALLLPQFAAIGEDIREPLSASLAGLEVLQRSLSETREGAVDLRSTMAAIPDITTKYARSKRRVLRLMDELVSKYDSALGQAEEARRTFESIKRSTDENETA